MNHRKIPPLLLKWFGKHKRPLPWRKTRDPYKIWVSEIMLQQTQVNTVIPYYERWMNNFPHLRRLAGAPLSRVLKSWEGLGYYSRARNLHRTAKIIVKKWGGKFPDSREALEALPGIGRYTAGAIASIAFGKPEPVLDGNVKRVLARTFALREPVDQTKGEKKLWVIAHELVVGAGLVPARGVTHRAPMRGAPTGAGLKSRYGNFNQALMELGALICLPENPKCFVCPLEKNCRAHRLKKETEFPARARREKTEKLKTVAVVIWKNGRVLLEKQPLRARWGGLWMFPQWKLTNGHLEEKFLRGEIQRDLGIRVQNLKPKMEVKHGFTKYRVRLRVYEGEVGARFTRLRGFAALADVCRTGSASATDGTRRRVAPSRVKLFGFPSAISGAPTNTCRSWIHPARLPRLPFPSPHQKIAASITSHA